MDMDPVGDYCQWDTPPHSGIGVATTLPVDKDTVIPPKNPIGFVWSSEESDVCTV